MLTLNELARALGGKISSGQVLAPGPNHSAKDRSLSVRLSDDAPYGFIVHSYADDDPIVCRDYVIAKCSLPAFKPNGHGNGKREPVNTLTYTYRNTNGEEIYRKERYEYSDGSKSFAIKPKGRNGSQSLLYGGERLADLGEGQPVWLVEGEKKVDRLRELGGIAVCCDSGAKSKWLPEHAELLRGLPVILWPDSDEPGEKYISRAAAAIRKLDSASSIRVVRPFQMDGGKGRDVCNWEGDAAALNLLAKGAMPYEVPQGKKDAGATLHESTADPKAAAEEMVCGTIRFLPAKLHVIADEAERAIIKAELPVFHRGGYLVEPSTERVLTYGGGWTHTVTLRELEKPRLLDLMSKTAIWEKYSLREKRFIRCPPPAIGAEILLARGAGHWSFPRVSGVITTPTLRHDGSILSEPGYDPATQLFHAVDPTLTLPHLNEEPTKEEALAALVLLEGLLTEFPFADPEIDKAVALSALITPVVRAAIDVSPMHAIAAPEYGSGKSYFVNLVSAIVSGAPCPVTTAGRDEAETDKRLDAALLKCQPIISLDNVNEVLCSDRLAVAVEQPMASVRVLGFSKTVNIENKVCIFATGCNITVRGDMVRRTLLCSIDPNEEAPEKRTFKRDPYQEIIADRGKYIAASMTIVRAYLAAGEPQVKYAKLVSFGAWSRFVQRPLIWLGCADPVRSIAIIEEADPDRGGIAEVLAAWHNSLGDEAFTLKAIAARAQAKETDGYSGGGFINPDLRDALMNIAPNKDGSLNTKRLGYWLRKNRGKIIGGMKAVPAARDDHTKVARWRVIKTMRMEQ